MSLALLQGCASLTRVNSALEAARVDYRGAQANESVFLLAGSDLERAGDALKDADRAWRRHAGKDVVDALARLVTERVAQARTTAAERMLELGRMEIAPNVGR